MDEDLNEMTREEMIEEVKKLRQGIRKHRDSSLHELCWHLGFLTVLSFIIDYVASAYGVKRSGAGRQAIVGSLVGLTLGLVLGIPGIIFGPFIGAVIGEFMANKDLLRAGRAGFGTWIGLVIGMAARIAIAFTMIGTFIVVYVAGK